MKTTEYRATQNGNTYLLRTRGRGSRERVLGGSWIRGRAQNLTAAQFSQFLAKMLLKITQRNDQ